MNLTPAQQAVRAQIDAAVTDPKLRLQAYIKAGVDVPADHAPPAPKVPERNWAGPLNSAALGGLGVLHGITAAFGSGREMGQAAGTLAQGLSHAVTGAASGFIHVGETILGLVLSPFGASGAGVAKLAGGLGGGIVGLLTGGGNVAAAGLKIGVGLAAGIAAGLGVAAGAGAGGLLGAILGTVIPGGGTAAGAILGAGIGAAVAGTVVQALAGVAGLVSSSLGQALSAIGTAFGALGKSIGDMLGSVKSVLSDLIGTAARLASATLRMSRGGNLGLGASAGLASLGQILTGSPDGLAGAFTGFGHFSQYQGIRLRAFGVAGATGTDPLGDIGAASSAYNRMDPIRRALLVQGGFGGNAALGNLLALGALPGGAGVVARTLATARGTGLSPRETIQNAKLALDLAGAQAQLDRLKTRLLSDLMPAINLVLGAFGKWFAGHESAILKGLESIGQWMYVKLPTFLETGLRALTSFGEAFAAGFPKVFAFGLTVMESAIQTIQKIAGELAGPVGLLSPTAGKALKSFAGVSLKVMGLESEDSEKQKQVAARRRAQADHLDDVLSKRQYGLDHGLAAPGNDLTNHTPAEVQADINGQRAVVRRLRGEADRADAEARRINPLTAGVQSGAGAAGQWVRTNGDKAQGFFGGAFGTEADREKAWNRGRHGIAPPPSGMELHGKLDQTLKVEIDLEKMRQSITSHLAAQEIRCLQRSGA